MRAIELILLATLTSSAIAGVVKQFNGAPIAVISNGTVVGYTNKTTHVDNFMGIPYAIQPTGTLRLTNPSPMTTGFGTFTATALPTACPGYQIDSQSFAKLNSSLASLLSSNVTTGENCLNLNVQRTEGLNSSSKVPVLVWIYGGGFEAGSTSQYDWTPSIVKAASLKLPLIVVSMSYRLGALGFLPGKEMQGNSNLGLKDQRLALKWIQDNIAAFGGDPDRVTIWGESAGSTSVCDQLLIDGGNIDYNGGKLFQGAIMNSGSILPALNISAPYNQQIYDHVVEACNCTDSSDTLSCLRSVPSKTIIAAQEKLPGMFNYQGLHLTWFPRPDPSDGFFPKSPEVAINSTAYAKVPIIIGDDEDEGTLFSQVQQNITTNDDLIGYIQTFFPESEPDVSETLVNSYPNDPAFGSPYMTGNKYNIYPQYKRLAAILGDFSFTLMRRAYLSNVTSQGVSAWSYINTFDNTNSSLGAYHGIEITNDETGKFSKVAKNATQTYYISFIYHQDPNSITPSVQWPMWTNEGRALLNFTQEKVEVGNDTFREAQYQTLLSLNGRIRQ